MGRPILGDDVYVWFFLYVLAVVTAMAGQIALDAWRARRERERRRRVDRRHAQLVHVHVEPDIDPAELARQIEDVMRRAQPQIDAAMRRATRPHHRGDDPR